MPATATATIDELICESVKQTDEANLRGKYSDQDEFVIVDEFLPQEVLNRWEVELETIKPHTSIAIIFPDTRRAAALPTTP